MIKYQEGYIDLPEPRKDGSIVEAPVRAATPIETRALGGASRVVIPSRPEGDRFVLSEDRVSPLYERRTG